LRLQEDVLDLIACEHEPRGVLDSLCTLVEKAVPESVAWVMLLDRKSGSLHVASAPSLSPEVREELSGRVPGSLTGACGAAVHTGELVVVEDTLIDPLWAGFQELQRRTGLRSCWSVPIRSRADGVLGTFAISRTQAGAPDAGQLRLTRTAVNLAEIVIIRHRSFDRLAQKQLLIDSVVSGSEDPIFVKDHELRYILVNEADARGVADDVDAILGKTDAELYPQSIAQRSRRMDLHVLESGESIQYVQEFDNPVEGKRTFYIRKSALLDARQQPIGVIGVARDITALQRTEEAMRQAQKLESLGVLAGGIAHDFNNLLTGILGNADLALTDVPPGSPLSPLLADIRLAATRAAELTHQMLAYSGRGELVRTALRLPEVIEEVAGLLASSISKKARLEYHFDPDLPPIEADSAQIRQLVMNLLTNASEALGGEPGTVTVTIGRVGADEPQERDRVELAIADTGCGMDDETIGKIFDPFFTTKFSGRGLGLAAVQGIVRGHDGEIRVESTPGEGTCFRVRFPALPPSQRAAPAVSDPEQWVGDGTVLVVDDEVSIQQLTTRVLERAGLAVLVARDGAEAVRLLDERAQAIDVVLLDLTMPRLGGFEVHRRLRALRADLPVVLTSGYSETEATSDFPSELLTSFLKKPFSPSELVGAVRLALRCGRANAIAR
jgi:PAS domain S-box-containing protein